MEETNAEEDVASEQVVQRERERQLRLFEGMARKTAPAMGVAPIAVVSFGANFPSVIQCG